MSDLSQEEVCSHNALMMRAVIERLAATLGAFFGGYMMIDSPGLNDTYLILVKNARLFVDIYPALREPFDEVVGLFPNLYEAGEPEFPDEAWEFGGEQAVRRLQGRASEIYVQEMRATVELNEDEQRFLKLVDESISNHTAQKRRIWNRVGERARSASETAPWATPSTAPESPRQRAEDAPLHDRAHAACVEALVAKLRKDGHDARPEGTYSRYGERGSVDVYYFSGEDSPYCAVYEVWTHVDNLNASIRKLDEKARVFPLSFAEQQKFRPPALTRAHFVVLATEQNMRVIADHQATFEAKFSDALDEGRHFILEAFDPLSGELHVLLPAPTGASLSEAELRRWQRFSSKQKFYEAWQSRKQRKE
jgi:hypothetical protein